MTYQIIVSQGSDDLATAVNAAIAADSTLAPIGGAHQLGSQWSQALYPASSGGGSGASYTLPAATADALGGVKLAANQTNAGSSSATDVTTLVTDFNTLATKYNALLAALQAAGIMAAS